MTPSHNPFSPRYQSVILASWEDTQWTVIEIPSIASQEKALANPTHISWTEPTTNVDGTPIASGEITGYQVGIRSTTAPGSVAGTYPTIVSVSGASTLTEALSAISPALTAGSYAVAVMAVGPVDSAWSAETTFTIGETPSAPTGVTVS